MKTGLARRDLELIYRAAIDAAEPYRLVTRALGGELGAGVPAMVAAAQRVFAIAVGKAASGMMRGIEGACGDRLAASIVIVPERAGAESGGRSSSASRAAVYRGGHPIPNAASQDAARAGLALARAAGPSDLLIVAVSGGASALMALPNGAITLADKIAVTRLLLASGAAIGELNTVRRHLSAIKGGGLLRAVAGARVVGLMLSDVAGNDLSAIGSGPTAADLSTYAEAREVLNRYGLWDRVPRVVRRHLESGAAGELAETLKPDDPIFERVINLVIGDNRTALAGAAEAAASLGYQIDRWRELYGEARELGRALAAHLGALGERRLCILAGGEPVVTVRGDGQGGRAQELALSLALDLDRLAPARSVAVLAAGSDGIDGPTDAAGAFAFADTVARALAAGVDAKAALASNDSYRVFDALGDLFRPGPTGTNVADLVIALID
jgi:glycerate 2-kinase